APEAECLLAHAPVADAGLAQLSCDTIADCAALAAAGNRLLAHTGASRNVLQPIAALRFASTASRNPSVESHAWSGPTRTARSFVILPCSMVETVTFSKVSANFFRFAFRSSLARWARPRVQAKIDAVELVEVLLPC